MFRLQRNATRDTKNQQNHNLSESRDANTEMSQILKLTDKFFKVTVIKSDYPFP